MKHNHTAACAVLVVLMAGCASPGNKTNKEMTQKLNEPTKGTYGYDVAFFNKQNIESIELKDTASKACILLIPAYQGRVMTSTAGGAEGLSYGWINHDLISSGKISRQFNPFGGEERFWLGPEGGPFSIYFDPGKEQVFENWQVPAALDTEPFDIKEQNAEQITFVKNASLKNASGTEFKLGIERKISLLPANALNSLFGVDVPAGCEVVAYQTENTITNTGDAVWTKKGGLLSIWMLGMFNPSPSTTVFIPYKQDGSGAVVNDEYFGKVPADRLIFENGTIFFKIDGKLRSKIGVPPTRATELCGSYDEEKSVLTLLWCSLPSGPADYVNSKWGKQDNPYEGDVVNSYNDGPVDDGSIMGPFYEIETSSPAAALAPGESLTHTQRVIHMQGEPAQLASVVKALFNLDLNAIAAKF